MAEKRGRLIRVLIIEDDIDYIDLVHQVLTPHGFKLQVCKSGEDGLETAKKERPDLIVLDIMMPGIHGLHALQQLKADPATARCKVIIFSSFREKEMIAQALSAGAAAYIPKNAPIKTLIDTVLSVVNS